MRRNRVASLRQSVLLQGNLNNRRKIHPDAPAAEEITIDTRTIARHPRQAAAIRLSPGFYWIPIPTPKPAASNSARALPHSFDLIACGWSVAGRWHFDSSISSVPLVHALLLAITNLSRTEVTMSKVALVPAAHKNRAM